MNMRTAATSWSGWTGRNNPRHQRRAAAAQRVPRVAGEGVETMIGRIKIYDYVGQNEGGGREEYEAFAEFSERDDVTTIEMHGYRRSEQVEEVEPPLSSPAHGVWGAMHPK